MDTNASVRVRGLRKSYGDVAAVDGVDLDIRHGEVFALLGPNGAGKTTTVEILEGYRRRDGGEVSVLGTDPDHGGREWRSRIGIVLQSNADATELTVREMIRHFAAYYPDPADPDEVIESVGLTEKAGSRLRQLSGGQRRRVDVALGIVGNPELIFLDEPTTGFDPEARRQFWHLIESLAHSVINLDRPYEARLGHTGPDRRDRLRPGHAAQGCAAAGVVHRTGLPGAVQRRPGAPLPTKRARPGSASFFWTVAPAGKPIIGDHGKCLDDFGAGTANGTKVDIWTCNGTAAQRWTFSGGALSVLGKCLDDLSGGGAGSKLVIFTCTGHRSQTWSHRANGEYVLRLNGLCLTDPSGSTVNGTQVEIRACQDFRDQRWSGP